MWLRSSLLEYVAATFLLRDFVAAHLVSVCGCNVPSERLYGYYINVIRIGVINP